MKIEWIGHSCFLIQGENPPVRILIDPYIPGAYDGAIGYRPIHTEVDIVLVTHSHLDHGGQESLPGNPLVVRADSSAWGIDFETVDFPHDAEGGGKRGWVKSFVFELDGIQVAHLSDIGDYPEAEKLSRLEEVEILMIPVGGWYTIDGKTAGEICDRVQPNVVIPMHYKTSKVAMALQPVEIFLEGQAKVRQVRQTTLSVSKKELPEPVTCVVLSPSH